MQGYESPGLDPPAQARARIVVGVSESLAGLQALRHAVAQARRLGASVLAVRAYEFSAPWRGYDVDECRRELADEAAAATRRAFDDAMGGPPSDVVVEAVAVAEPAGVALVARCQQDVDLLVVGAPSRWWLRSSVARYCVRHADCPVVVVPAPSLARLDRRGALSRAMQREVRRLVDADGPDSGRSR